MSVSGEYERTDPPGPEMNPGPGQCGKLAKTVAGWCSLQPGHPDECGDACGREKNGRVCVRRAGHPGEHRNVSGIWWPNEQVASPARTQLDQDLAANLPHATRGGLRFSTPEVPCQSAVRLRATAEPLDFTLDVMCSKPDAHEGQHEGRVSQPVVETPTTFRWTNEETLRASVSSSDRRASSDKNVLEEAAGLIYGDRVKDYGPPTESFSSIARLWSAYLETKLRTGGPDATTLTAVDVSHMMTLMKVSRAQTGGTYKRDNYVDIAGYAGCVERMEEGR